MAERNESQAQLIISREFDAPRELVFNAFTQAKHLARWWGPKGFELTVHKLDFRPGGVFHYSMHGSGHTMWGKFIYRSIKSPEALEFVSSFSDENENIIPAPFPGLVFPMEVLNRWTFTENAGRTRITIHAEPLNATPDQVKGFTGLETSMQEGYGGTFEKLDELLVDLLADAR